MGRAGLVPGFGYAGWSDGTMGRPAAHRFSETVHCTNEAVSRIKRCQGVCWEETLGERDRNVPHRPMGREQMWMLPRLSTNFANWITLRGLWVSSWTRWAGSAGQSMALRWNATLRERGIPSPRVLLSEWAYGFTTGMCSCRKPETYHNNPVRRAGLAGWIGWSQFVRLGD